MKNTTRRSDVYQALCLYQSRNPHDKWYRTNLPYVRLPDVWKGDSDFAEFRKAIRGYTCYYQYQEGVPVEVAIVDAERQDPSIKVSIQIMQANDEPIVITDVPLSDLYPDMRSFNRALTLRTLDGCMRVLVRRDQGNNEGSCIRYRQKEIHDVLFNLKFAIKQIETHKKDFILTRKEVMSSIPSSSLGTVTLTVAHWKKRICLTPDCPITIVSGGCGRNNVLRLLSGLYLRHWGVVRDAVKRNNVSYDDAYGSFTLDEDMVDNPTVPLTELIPERQLTPRVFHIIDWRRDHIYGFKCFGKFGERVEVPFVWTKDPVWPTRYYLPIQRYVADSLFANLDQEDFIFKEKEKIDLFRKLWGSHHPTLDIPEEGSGLSLYFRRKTDHACTPHHYESAVENRWLSVLYTAVFLVNENDFLFIETEDEESYSPWFLNMIASLLELMEIKPFRCVLSINNDECVRKRWSKAKDISFITLSEGK